MIKYKVRFMMDDTYQVVQIEEKDLSTNDYEEYENVVHQGGLADCEAYIRLKEGGYM